MSTLNIVNKSPFEKHTLAQCLRRISGGSGEGNSLLLIEDGSISALSNTACKEQLLAAANNVKLYVLQPDLDARGFAGADLLEPVNTVDYSGFVELVVTHDRVHSWL